MKILLLSVILLISSKSLGQVGINTEIPKATLDVTGNPTIATKLDGVIAPRITGEQLRLKTYTTDQTGAIVYVTSAAIAPLDNQIVMVSRAGYYYFDGIKWVLMSKEPWKIAGTTEEAYENTQNIYQTGNVGIREANPASALSIVNDNQNDNYDDIAIETYSNGSQTPAFVYKSFAGTKASPANLANNAFLGSLYFRGYANNASNTLSAILSKYKGNGTTLLSNLEFYTSNQTATADPKMILDEKGYLGVNELNPKSTLSVNGSISVPFRVITGSTTLTSSDYAIYCAGIPTGGLVITLPDPTTCNGRMYKITIGRIRELGGGATFSMAVISPQLPATNNIYDLMANFSSDGGPTGNADSMTIISDGANWYHISK